jgi:hypothetical protein
VWRGTWFVILGLVLSQPDQAHHGAEFQRFRLLLARNLDGLLETRFGLRL